jgi:hypothetical protein
VRSLREAINGGTSSVRRFEHGRATHRPSEYFVVIVHFWPSGQMTEQDLLR